jgi:hypothetical protein
MNNDTIKEAEAQGLQTGDQVETKTVKVSTVRPGDIVKGRVVAGVKSGTKWTYLRDSSDKVIAEVRNDGSIAVERKVRKNQKVAEPVATSEPSVEEMRAHANAAIEQKIKTRRTVFDEISTKAAKEMSQQGFLSPQTLGILLTAQADLRLMEEFSALVDFTASSSDLVTLQKEFAQRLIDRLVAGMQNSTIVRQEESSVTRVMDECEKESMARFIENARWYL